MAEIGVDLYQKYENVVRLTAPKIRQGFQSSVTSSGLNRVSGKLQSGFQERVMKDGIEVWAVKFRMPKYGFILNNGMKAQSVSRNGKTYQHPGFPERNFIAAPLERGKIMLSEKLSIVTRDLVVDELSQAFD